MQAHRAEAVLSEDGVITVRNIPFRRGESVEVIVLPFPAVTVLGSPYPLRGTPVKLVDPAEPVAAADWGGLRVIILDTHIWIWWVHGDPALSISARALLDSSEQSGIGVSAISGWEVAKLVEHRRLSLPCPVFDGIEQALSYPGVRLMDLSPRVCVESTQLPGEFHRDPADQIIVATARVLDVPLVSVDAKILAYPHVRHAPTGE